MTATRAQKVRLGLFGIASFGALAIVLAVFAGLRFWEHHDRFVIYFNDSVLGLENGAPVSFAGIKVGSVKEISVAPDDPRKVKVTIQVKRGLPIRTDTTATLTLTGITGLKAIDLHGGDVRSPRLAPGGVIALGESTLDRLERQARGMVDQSQEILEHANRVAANLEELTAPSQFQGMAEIVSSMRSATADLAAASADLHGMIAENRGAIRRTVANVDHAAGRASALLDGEVPRLVGGAGALVDELRAFVRDNGGYVRSTLFDLRQAGRSFKELARDLRQRPSRLLFARPAHERELP
ncbi:MAG TPA: MlaD family protein [Kofleriaceae bacterium]|nr:MlaD family protein [Kofleriaceae bacterium]